MSFTKVAPAGIGTEPGNSILIGDSLLHSTGIDIGSNTGIGVTIRKHGDATFTGIITASAFFGDGSGLEGVSSSGIGTPLSDDDTSELNKVYYVNQELSIGSTVTVNHPDSAIASYTHYQDLVVKDNADFIVADGDTFIPDVLGINTSSLPNPVSGATGGRIRAGTITNAGANGAPNFPNGLTGTAGTFTGNLNVGGVLTYEDVTNVDSVGVITARSGIRIGATGANTLISGTATGIGIGTDAPYTNGLLHCDGHLVLTAPTNAPKIIFDEYGSGTDPKAQIEMDQESSTAASMRFYTEASGTLSERLRIASNGALGIAGANYGSSGQVLTSQGSGSAVQWATPSSGDYVKLQRGTNGYVASYVFDDLDVATYKFFDFNAAFVPGDDGQYPYFRFRTGGASGADVTGSHYSYGYGESYPSNNYTQGSQTGHSQVTLSGTVGYNTNNGEGLRINMRIMFADANDNGSSGQLSNFITYQYIRVDASGNPRMGHGSAIYNENTSTYPTGFRLYMASGGINANSYGLYGMKR